MRKCGHRILECPVEVQLFGRIVDVVIAADDVGHARMDVVHDDREVVSRRSVGSDDHKVIDLRVLDADGAADEVKTPRRPQAEWPRE